MPIHFTVMDLIGMFKWSHHGHQYALTVIDMLTNYTWCIPLHTMEAGKEVYTYLINIYSKFFCSHKVLSDKATELKKKTSCLCRLLPLCEGNKYLLPPIILKAMGMLNMYIAF